MCPLSRLPTSLFRKRSYLNQIGRLNIKETCALRRSTTEDTTAWHVQVALDDAHARSSNSRNTLKTPMKAYAPK
jgi:hypothetical protein